MNGCRRFEPGTTGMLSTAGPIAIWSFRAGVGRLGRARPLSDSRGRAGLGSVGRMPGWSPVVIILKANAANR